MRDPATPIPEGERTGRRTSLTQLSVAMLGLGLSGVLIGCGGDSSTTADAGASAAPEVVAVDTVNSGHPGAALYSSQCSQCHNGNGSGNPQLRAPSLTTLDSWYVERQLAYFRDGLRGNHPEDTHGQIMAAASAKLSDDDITLLANYVGELPALPVSATLSGDLKLGKDYHLNLCAACHGSNGLGNEALSAPALAGVNDWYLVSQYEHFRAGRRGTHPDDPWGAQMHRLAPAIPEDVVISIASYQATLSVND